MQALEQWVCSSNNAISIALVKANDLINEENKPEYIKKISFHPTFSYPLFGFEEKIYGYKNLDIQLYYCSGSLDTYFHVDYAQKLDPEEVKKTIELPINVTTIPAAEDVESKILPHLKEKYTSSLDEFMNLVEIKAKTFKPYGEKISEYRLENEDNSIVYEYYKCSLRTPGFKEYHRRLQLFLLWTIEGASYIDETDNKWIIYTLYQKVNVGDSVTYNLVGYCTCYPFYVYPNKLRMRISQFLILPPYQRKHHGEKLYQKLYEIYSKDKQVACINVEDPNEKFSDMRDIIDLRLLFATNIFDNIEAPIPENHPVLLKIRDDYKFSRRQSHRYLEIALLKKLQSNNPEKVKNYRLQVKRRIYKQNYDVISQMDKNERYEKLEETYQSLINEYRYLLSKI